MDDLERLLSNIDSDSEADQTKEELIRSSERIARKGDSTADSDFDDNLESFEIKIDRLRKTQSVQRFIKGYIPALKLHWNLVLDFKNILTDVTLPDPVIDALRKYKYNFIRFLENIEKLFDNFVTSKTIDDLEKNARQDFSLYFPAEDITTERLNFLIIKELFIRLRELNAKLKREWNSLASSITVMNLVNEGKDFYSKTNDYVSGGLKLCNDTDRFLEFLASVLRIHKKDIDVLEKEIQTKIVFKNDFNYEYNSLFRSSSDEKSSESMNEQNTVSVPDIDIDPMVHIKQSGGRSQGKSFSGNNDDISRQIGFADFVFKIPGKSSWNRREPYIITIDHGQLRKNMNDIRNMIYYTEEHKKKILIDAAIKRSVIRFMREKRAVPFENYEEFIFRKISGIFDILIRKFQLPVNYIQLFEYHCGPLTIYTTIMRMFAAEGIGTCYKFISESKISRIRPDEIIKYLVLKWFQQNINDLDLPFDRVQEYNVLKEIINHHYTNDLRDAKRKVDAASAHYQSRTGKQLDKNAFMKMKAYSLFEPETIEVYRRFIERTLF